MHIHMHTSAAIRAHLFPNVAWSTAICRSSSGVNAPFFKSGLRWLAHLKRQLFPHRLSPVCFWTAFQLPSPCLFTYSTKIASSVDVQGPFFSAGVLTLPQPSSNVGEPFDLLPSSLPLLVVLLISLKLALKCRWKEKRKNK